MFLDRFGQSLYMEEEVVDNSEKFNRVLSIARELHKEWIKFDYGIQINGKTKPIPSPEYFKENYKSLTPDEFEKYHGGVCWDYVEWGEKFLKQHNVQCRKFYMWNDKSPEADTHTFIVIDLSKEMDRYIYIEAAFEYIHGVYIFNALDEIYSFITSSMFHTNGDGKAKKKFRYVVFEYTVKHPPYGSNPDQFTKWIVDYCRDVYQDIAVPKFSGEYVQEAKLSTDDRKDLNDNQFGIPELRKYPLTDKEHVLQAVRFFNKAPNKYKKELAENIVKRTKELNMDWEKWDVLKPYLTNTIQESSQSNDNNRYIMRLVNKNKIVKESVSYMDNYEEIRRILYRDFDEDDDLFLEAANSNENSDSEEDENDTNKEETDDEDISSEVGDDSDEDLSEFGNNGGDDLPNNEYDQEEVDNLNKLIASESQSISEYMEASKVSNVDVLRRLYSDIGNEERFHMEQLLYAKSELTGDKYEPRDPDVRKEYEELLELGMDEESAMTTAIDKLHIRVKSNDDDGEESDLDKDLKEIEEDVNMVESYVHQTNMLLLLCEMAYDNDDEETMTLFTESYFAEAVMNPRMAQKQFHEPINPIKILLNLLGKLIQGIVHLGASLGTFVTKTRMKNEQVKKWLQNHKGTVLKDFFSNGIHIYFYDDDTKSFDTKSIQYYKDLLETCVFKISKVTKVPSKFTNSPVDNKTLDEAIAIVNNVMVSKTKVIINDDNKDNIINALFGKTDKTITHHDPSASKPIVDYENIYSVFQVAAERIGSDMEKAKDFLEKLQHLEGDPNSIYRTNRSLWNKSVQQMKSVVNGYGRILSCITSDTKAMYKINTGIYEQYQNELRDGQNKNEQQN